MAESVSDQNVEDMLSSVRRLVSSELPRNQRPSLKEGASALVLTEAQRVEPKPPIQAQRGLTLEERIAELEAAVDGQTNDWEPDGSEDQEMHRPDKIVYRPSRPLDDAQAQRPLRLSEIALIETGPAHQDEAEGEADIVQDNEAPEFHHEPPETDLVQAASDSLDESVEETPKVEKDKPIVPPAALSGDPFADAIARDVAAVVAEMAGSSLSSAKDFDAALAEAVRDPAETRGLRQRVAEVVQDKAASDDEDSADDLPTAQPLVLGSQADPEEQEADSKPTAALSADHEPEATSPVEVSPFEQHAEPSSDEDHQPVESAAIAAPDTSEDELGAGSAPQENLLTLTPEQLRLLVSSMIHQELQGELGERITRNVRKLVRQEVHRALSVRDLE